MGKYENEKENQSKSVAHLESSNYQNCTARNKTIEFIDVTPT